MIFFEIFIAIIYVLIFSFCRHIAEDLIQMNLPNSKPLEEMTENERNFLYFKAHDLDGNGKLDGLEMYYSATHHSLSQADHEHEHEHEHEQEHEAVQDNDEKIAQGKANFRLLSPSGNGKPIDVNFNHVVGKINRIFTRIGNKFMLSLIHIMFSLI